MTTADHIHRALAAADAARAFLERTVTMPATETGHITACMTKILHASYELQEAINRDEHPNRIRDYVRDVERWCSHMHGHMQEKMAAGETKLRELT